MQTSSAKTTQSRTIISSLKWMYASSMLLAVMRLVVLAALARLLEPGDFGLLGIALIFTSCAERIGQVGVGPAFVQKSEVTPHDISTAGILSLASGVLISASLIALAPYAAIFFQSPPVADVLRVLALGFIIDGFAVIPDALLQRQMRFKDIVVAENVAYIIGNLIVALTLAWFGCGVWALVIASLVMKLVRLGWLLAYAPAWSFGHFEWKTARGLLNMGVGFSLGRVLSFAALQGDNFVVGRLLGVEVLGMYTRAYQLMTLPATYLGQVLERVLFPAMSKSQGNPEKLKTIFFSSLEIVALVAGPISVGMFLLSEEIILVLFGPRWHEAVGVLRLLSLGVFFRSAYKSSDTLARSFGAVYRHAFRQGLYSALVVGGSALGCMFWGLQGVAIAVVVAVVVNYFAMSLLAKQLLALTTQEIIRPHLPGAWVSTWIAIVLLSSLNFIRPILCGPKKNLSFG